MSQDAPRHAVIPYRDWTIHLLFYPEGIRLSCRRPDSVYNFDKLFPKPTAALHEAERFIDNQEPRAAIRLLTSDGREERDV